MICIVYKIIEVEELIKPETKIKETAKRRSSLRQR